MGETDLTIAEARDALRAKKLSSRELTDAHVKAMAKATVDRFGSMGSLAAALAGDFQAGKREAGSVNLPQPNLLTGLVTPVGGPTPARAC